MRISIPGFDGLYYDTDAESSAVQLLPYLWSFDVDLREIPNDHPIQYLHPEGAQSLGELPAERGVRRAGSDLESVLQFVWAVNQEIESATGKLVGRERDHDGVTIEITDGSVGVDGTTLETDEFDVGDGVADPSAETPIDIDDLEDADDAGEGDDAAEPDHDFGDDGDRDREEY
jgi:hypothetical protein